MQLQYVFLLIVLVTGLPAPVHGLFEGTSLQDYVDSFIDVDKFRQHGISSLNETTVNLIWSFFKAFHQRVYSSGDEEEQRRRIFHDNVNFVLKHQLKLIRTFELELNELADLTADEFKQFKKGFVVPKDFQRRIEENSDAESEETVLRALAKPYQHHHERRWKRNIIKRIYISKNGSTKRFFRDWLETLSNENSKRSSIKNGGGNKRGMAFDWRDQNVVGSIKNQLQCGCCYAFATAAVMESLYAIKNNAQSVIDLSPQQIVDCGGKGCNGGNFPGAISYLMEQGGQMATFTSYPYVGMEQTCTKSNLNYVNLENIKYTSIPEGDEVTLAEDLVSYGPIFVGVDASSPFFKFYKSGILNTNECSNLPQDLDHAIVVVGYGYNATLQQSYWIVKNSWGTQWGESGYLLLAKDSGNMCGVATGAYYAQLT